MQPVAQGANVTVWASRIGLADTYAPSFTQSPQGSLIQSMAPVDGERAVNLRGEDHGGGISAVAFVIDGRILEERPADPLSSSCSQPYVSRVRCPLAIDTTLTLDTTRLSNGRHQIQVALIDAAGNRTLSHATGVDVRNSGAPNGIGSQSIRTYRGLV